MAYKIVLFRAAIEDFTESEAWYQVQSPPSAARFAQAYLDLIHSIAENPAQFPVIYQDHIRRARFAAPFPFSLFFFVKEDTAFVISIFHDRRDPVVWKGRVL